MSIRCAMGWHRWGKWSEVKTIRYRKTGFNVAGVILPLERPVECSRDEQGRTCERCGETQTREV